MGTMFQQAALAVGNPAVFEPVKAALESSFATAKVSDFLKRVDQAKLRVRNFEQVLERGLLGQPAKAGYAELGNSDRGQIRELYLRLVEQVPVELRGKYLKIYSYY